MSPFGPVRRAWGRSSEDDLLPQRARSGLDGERGLDSPAGSADPPHPSMKPGALFLNPDRGHNGELTGEPTTAPG